MSDSYSVAIRVAWLAVFVLAALSWPAGTMAQESQWEIATPILVNFRDQDGALRRGRVNAFDASGFTFHEQVDQEVLAPRQVAWTIFDGQIASRLISRMLRPNDGPGWLMAGDMLIELENAQRVAEQAYRRAAAIDPALVPRSRSTSDSQEGEQAKDTDAPGHHHQGEGDHGPIMVGQTDVTVWPKLDDAQNAQAVAELHQFAREALEKAGIRAGSAETQYFVLYTNLTQAQGQRWMRLLDRMYARLLEVFDLPRGSNIWQGKALVVILQKPEEYYAYNQAAYGKSYVGSAGVCVSYGSGQVKISFYRQPDEGAFAHILVHETVHGFVHRYIGPRPVPSWVNEGLAELVANELVPGTGIVDRHKRHALMHLEKYKHMGEFFVASHIDAWQYGMAYDLTATMVRENRRGYVAFFRAIKEGKPWPDALREDYGLSVERLVDGYARVTGVSGLKATLPEAP